MGNEIKDRYKLKEIMGITGLSKRTLHYYDEIGLLFADKNKENGYREYSQRDLIKLQKIMLLKALDLDLKDIKDMVDKNDDELRVTLEPHQEKLRNKIRKLEDIEKELKKFIDGKSSFYINSESFNLSNQYEKEAEIRYGETDAYKDFKNRRKNINFNEYSKELEDVFQSFSDLNKREHSEEEIRRLVKNWKDVLKKFAEFDDKVLILIARTYKEDERFHEYFKRFNNENLIDFIIESVEKYI